MQSPDKSAVVIALIGSNITATAAELAVQVGGYSRPLAIVRRGTKTTLPTVPDGSAWVDRMKRMKNMGARKEIRAFERYIEELTGGERFDCLIHHSKNAFSQLLVSHRLCRRYFYIEEGITAMVGGPFGRPKKRTLKKLAWNIRSWIFYGGQVNKAREFFDTRSPKYGGACAISAAAFQEMPNRIQLPFRELSATTTAHADVMIFTDSQYRVGNCKPDDYIAALVASVAKIVTEPSSAAIKFHPAERDEALKQRFKEAIRAVPRITEVSELPPDFVAERMAFDPATKVLIGTSSLGFYLGERGFPIFTFAPRLAAKSPKFAAMMEEFPKEFRDVCQPA